jgi:diacylglycerol kinase (ATP)
MRALLFHNHCAGKGQPAADDLLALLEDAGLSASYRSTRDGDLATALREPVDLVVVAGGDGTVAQVVTALPDRSIPILVLPLGTANNIAGSLGIAGDPARVASGWRSARAQPVDLLRADGPWGSRLMLEGLGLGALARAGLAAERMADTSSDQLHLARDLFRQTLADGEPERLRLLLDGDELAGSFLLADALNLRRIGPGLVLAPDADPGDGLLDFIGVEPGDREAMLGWLDGFAEAPAPLSARRCRRVTFEWDGRPLRLGDELLEQPGQRCTVELAIEPGPVRILVPGSTN